MKHLTFIQLLFFVFATTAISKAQTSNTTTTTTKFAIPNREVNCFKNFNVDQGGGIDKINAYLLSRLAELMYTERLDFDLKRLKNPTTFPPSGFKSTSLNSSSNLNFENDYRDRFEHWFYDLNAAPQNPTLKIETPVLSNTPNVTAPIAVNKSSLPAAPAVGTAVTVSPSTQYQLDSIAFEKTKPKFRFLNKRQNFVALPNGVGLPGYDPEVMIISKETYIIIVWRGTDDVYPNDVAEWYGTDFQVQAASGDGPLANVKMHSGMWNCFKIVRNAIIRTLNEFEAKTKNKKIFVTGHSLGGGEAIISATYLQAIGYNIGHVYSFAGPKILGDASFKTISNGLLNNKIERFEYGLDFVPKLNITIPLVTNYVDAPGNRHWLNHAGDNDFLNTPERKFPLTLNPFEYNNLSALEINRDNGDFGTIPVLLAYMALTLVDPGVAAPKDIRGFPLVNAGHHNPQFYIKKMWNLLGASMKAKVPAFDDPFPYLYPAVVGNK
ncbi:MAG: lipase family protein [Chitinophagaceae bacterium]|uniref:lipase family protein n=1 Tax=unclassified Paraflavitalea TaxID=2798305 RepID=UPI003D342D3C|nr:lipase family protein [Chitinophagaceae bacterium]